MVDFDVEAVICKIPLVASVIMLRYNHWLILASVETWKLMS